MRNPALIALATLAALSIAAAGQAPDYWRDQATRDYYNGSYSLALQEIEEYLSTNGNDVTAWNSKGLILTKMKRYDDAVEAYDHALSLDGSNLDALINKGLILQGALGDSSGAIESLRRAVKIAPQNGQAWYNLGLVLESIESYDQSLMALQNATNLDPSLAMAWYHQGRVLATMESYNASLAALEEATRLDSRNAAAWNEKGLVLMKLGRVWDALDAFQEALNIDPANKEAAENKLKAEEALGGTSQGEMASSPWESPKKALQ
jgi:tetratricopeptide (TPR) repeat protein